MKPHANDLAIQGRQIACVRPHFDQKSDIRRDVIETDKKSPDCLRETPFNQKTIFAETSLKLKILGSSFFSHPECSVSMTSLRISPFLIKMRPHANDLAIQGRQIACVRPYFDQK